MFVIYKQEIFTSLAGEPECYWDTPLFVSDSKEMAEEFVQKYNDPIEFKVNPNSDGELAFAGRLFIKEIPKLGSPKRWKDPLYEDRMDHIDWRMERGIPIDDDDYKEDDIA